jgi:hypothetical protein
VVLRIHWQLFQRPAGPGRTEEFFCSYGVVRPVTEWQQGALQHGTSAWIAPG